MTSVVLPPLFDGFTADDRAGAACGAGERHPEERIGLFKGEANGMVIKDFDLFQQLQLLIVPPRLAYCADASGTLLNGSACDTAREAADQPSVFRNDRRPSSTRSALLTTSNPSRLVPILVPSLHGS
jgi:hypothetical protein